MYPHFYHGIKTFCYNLSNPLIIFVFINCIINRIKRNHGINTLLHCLVMVSGICTPLGSMDPHSPMAHGVWRPTQGVNPRHHSQQCNKWHNTCSSSEDPQEVFLTLKCSFSQITKVLKFFKFAFFWNPPQ